LDALSRGYKVVATARKLAAIDHLKKQGAKCLQLDVTASQDEISKVAKDAHAAYGRIDYVVNNAGIALTGNLEEFQRKSTCQTSLY
jgi:NADP-dependent 3-hydroxy acid dehydrogenase YdfG